MWIDAAAERKVKKPRNTQTLCFFQWFKAGVAENLYSQCLVSGTDYNNNNDNNNDNDNDNGHSGAAAAALVCLWENDKSRF
jgi:hypothetical protein